MSLSRVLGRASRTAAAQCRSFFFLSPPPPFSHQHHFSFLSNCFHTLSNVSNKASAFHHGLHSAFPFSHCGISSSASPEQEQGTPAGGNKETNGNVEAANQAETSTADGKSSQEAQQTGLSSESPSASQSVKRRRQGTKRIAFSDSDSDSEGELDDLSRDDFVKLVSEKKQVLEQKEKEFTEWKDKFLRSYAEMENVMERTRRDAENSKKFAVQSFAKSLLDVADNLGRASSVTKESFAKIDVSNDTVGAVPVLKTLLQGVEMTEKQLAEVFRKSGIEKYDPTNEQFDPNRHNAVFQVPDNSKPPGTVAVVMKAGYTLHERIIRPAEVGVTVAAENN